MAKIITIFHILNILTIKLIASDDIDWYWYYKMPLLHHNDDFRKCMHKNLDGYNVQCVANIIIKPDNSSPLWQYIEEFSSDRKRHFAHDIIASGLCISECERKLSKLSPEQLDDLYVPEFPYRVRYDWDLTAFKNNTEFRKSYSRIINQCNNLWLRDSYNLSGYSSIQFCTDNMEEQKIEYDFLHYLFLFVLFLIIAVISIASITDMKMNDENSLSYYKKGLKNVGMGKSALLCFSIQRNWYRLTSKPTDEFSRDLRFLLAVRYTTTFIVVLGHVIIGFSFSPNIRPEHIENTYHELSKLYENVGTSVVQTFFVTSGVLLYFSFSQICKDGKMNTKYFVIAFIYRYLRLTPAYAFLVLFHSTWLYSMGSGAFWKPFAEVEQTYCRRWWWSNLLYINNYVNPKELCMIQTWYLAADTQLFVFALFLFTFMWKFPKYKKHILGGAFFISCCIQFFVTYINGYDGMFFMTPELKRWLIYNVYEEFEKDYIATHTNGGNFLIGIALGMIYIHVKRNKLDFGKFLWFRLCWNILPIFGLFMLHVTTWLSINYDFEKPSIWISLMSVFTRNFWGLIAIIFVLGFLSSMKSPLKNFFNWPVFNTLARLTYCIYLVHMTVGRFLFGGLNERIDLTDGITLVYAISLFVLSNIAALFLCLCLEFPVTALTKELFKSQRAKLEETMRFQRESNNNEAELSNL